MKFILGLWFLIASNLLAAKIIQVSLIRPPGNNSPFGQAIHFRYEQTKKMAWIGGNSSLNNNFRWSKHLISDDEGRKIEKGVRDLKFDRAEKIDGSPDDVFRVTLDEQVIEWKGYYGDDQKNRSGNVTRLLSNLLEDQNDPLIHFSPFEGDVTLSLNCNSLTADGKITLQAINHGTIPAEVKPVDKHVVDYWGYLPVPTGDAAKTHEIPAGKSQAMTWQLDLDTMKKASEGSQLLYFADGILKTDLPEKMSPQYQTIQRCDLPVSLTKLPAKFDDRQTALPIKVLDGVWFTRAKTYLVIKDSKILFLGRANFGEHGTVYYSTQADAIKFNPAKQLRFGLGAVDYYANPFTPRRQVPGKKEPAVGGGNLDLRFEGVWSKNNLTLRCFSDHNEGCPESVIEFKRGSDSN